MPKSEQYSTRMAESNDIPTPKPNHWECSLDNTKPITLLKTLRKALVKLINARLSKIIAKRHILEGNNYARIPASWIPFQK